MASFQSLLTRLDRLPSLGALVIGVEVGIGAGVLALSANGIGLIGALLLGAAAIALALTGKPIWVDEIVEEPEESEPADLFKMVPIPGGTFLMGSPEDESERLDDERQHEVTVSLFLMSDTTVTRAMYRDVMGVDDAPGPGGDEQPVTKVSWHDAVAFCNRASEKAGFEPCYRIDGEAVEWVEGNGYRLPTEAEWEYAARAGTKKRWSSGNWRFRLSKYAWFLKNSGGTSHEVATRKPNPWGLYDMHGNVWEWCWDVYGDYPEEPMIDPKGASRAPSAFRVLRGGSFVFPASFLRSAFRRGPERELRLSLRVTK